MSDFESSAEMNPTLEIETFETYDGEWQVLEGFQEFIDINIGQYVIGFNSHQDKGIDYEINDMENEDVADIKKSFDDVAIGLKQMLIDWNKMTGTTMVGFDFMQTKTPSWRLEPTRIIDVSHIKYCNYGEMIDENHFAIFEDIMKGRRTIKTESKNAVILEEKMVSDMTIEIGDKHMFYLTFKYDDNGLSKWYVCYMKPGCDIFTTKSVMTSGDDNDWEKMSFEASKYILEQYYSLFTL